MNIFLPAQLPIGHQLTVLRVERRFTPLTAGEDVERCRRLRVLLLRGARRLAATPPRNHETKRQEVSHGDN